MPGVKEEEPKKLKPCCACPETRKVRDACTAVMDIQSEVYAELDIGNLCATNVVLLKPEPIKGEDRLLPVATKGAQFLLNQIFNLPSEYQGCDAIVKLPEPTAALPREKPLPKANPLTKWQQFAKKKGIFNKRKREKLVWDNATKEWKPRYGYRSIKNTTNDWMVELPDNADPNVDYLSKKKQERGEKVAKNEYQRLRNIASTSKISNLESYDEANKKQLKGSLLHAKNSTASMGKFTEAVRNEKPMRKPGKKNKMANLTENEKEDNLKQYEQLMKQKPKLDVKEAVDVHIAKKTKFKRPSAEGKKSNPKRKPFNKNKFNKKRNRKS